MNLRLGAVSRCLAVALLLTSVGAEPVHANDVLDPAVYSSPSGKYELSVNPSAMNGAGPADYLLSLEGREVWKGKHHFSLWDARVTDSGAVVGYAYREGVNRNGHHGMGYKDLAIIVLARDGRVVTEDPWTSHDAEVQTSPWTFGDSPAIGGVLANSEADRGIVHLSTRASDTPIAWWVYRISTGEALPDLKPKLPTIEGTDSYAVIDAEFVPGTPLILVQWYLYGYPNSGRVHGAALSLMTAEGDEIWKLELPGEYDSFGDEWSWWQMTRDNKSDIDLSPNAFSFEATGTAVRMAFSVTRDLASAKGWRVSEVGRRRIEDSDGASSEALVEGRLVELAEVGTIDLRSTGSEQSSIRDIHGFAIDPAGVLGFVNRGESGVIQFVRVHPDGQILTEVALDLPGDADASLPMVAPVSIDRWILTRSSWGDNRSAKAWWIDANTGAVSPIKGFKSAGVESIHRDVNGGFFTLERRSSNSVSAGKVCRYDQNGRQTWSWPAAEGWDGYGFESVALLAGGNLVVLGSSTDDEVKILDAQGSFVRSIEFATLLGRTPNYPAEIITDQDGGWILHDFNGSPEIYRIDVNDTVRSSFQPRFDDERTFRIYGGVQVGPNGTLWTSDSHSLLQLDENGVVIRILGRKPSDNALESVRALTLDDRGQIYALNDRTAAIHVFDANGSPLRVCTPLPTDLSTDSGLGHITVDGRGNVFFDTGAHTNRKRGYFGFTNQCERLGFKTSGIDSVQTDWLFKPETEELWVLAYEAVHLVNSNGELLKTIDRRPNRKWMRRVDDGAVAPDGSLVVIASSQGASAPPDSEVCIYGPQGAPKGTIAISNQLSWPRIAFNGSLIALAANGSVLLYGLGDEAPLKFVPTSSGDEEPWWYPTFSPDGSELWLRDNNEPVLRRFRLP